MSLQQIKYRRENPRSYPALADVAAKQERAQLWREAAESWERARQVAKTEHNKHWAQCRRDFCKKKGKQTPKGLTLITSLEK